MEEEKVLAGMEVESGGLVEDHCKLDDGTHGGEEVQGLVQEQVMVLLEHCLGRTRLSHLAGRPNQAGQSGWEHRSVGERNLEVEAEKKLSAEVQGR